MFVQIEFCLEAVLSAQNLQRQPGGHDLCDGGRYKGLVRALGHEFVAVGVDHEHHRPDGAKPGNLLFGASSAGAGSRKQRQGGIGTTAPMATPHRNIGQVTIVSRCEVVSYDPCFRSQFGKAR